MTKKKPRPTDLRARLWRELLLIVLLVLAIVSMSWWGGMVIVSVYAWRAARRLARGASAAACDSAPADRKAQP